MSNFGVVSTITALVLKEITQPCLIQFEKAYIEKIADVNRTREDGKKVQPASVRNCLEPILLKSLCLVGQIEGATRPEDATEAMVENWFNERLRSASRDLDESVRSAVDTVHYKQCKEDPQGAALTFILNVVKALERSNASEVITDKERCKGIINKLVHKLEPAELKEHIKDARECWSNDEKSSISFFQKRVAAVAAYVAQGEVARARLKRKHPMKQNGDEKAKNTSPNHKKSDAKHFKQVNTPKSEKKGKVKRFKYKCLDPVCPKYHLIKDCEDTSDERKKELLDEFYKNKKNVSAMATKKTLGKETINPNDEEGRYKVMLNDTLEAIAFGDYGADVSAMVPKVARKQLNVEKLDTPIEFSSCLGDAPEQIIELTASHKASIAVTIFLSGANIPVRIREVEFYATDQNLSEVILGRPLLKALGFDLKQHLLNVHEQVHNKKMSELQPHGNKLAAWSYKGLKHQAVDDDPVECPDVVAAGIGKDSKKSIDDAFSKIVNGARSNGISNKGEARLVEMLEDFRDCFRIKLGPDDPARVPPLRIDMRPNSRPYRSPQRRYSPDQRAFLTRTIRELEAVGAIYKNPSAKWPSPALAVPKSGSDKFRFTVDLRKPNAKTMPIQSAMKSSEFLVG